MRIKRLIVSKYKNVEKLNLKFDNHLISLLVGKNGLGKSNLIEILALIFRDLDLLNEEEEFRNWSYQDGHFGYYIHYECRHSEVRIFCHRGNFQVLKRRKNTNDRFTRVSFANFVRDRHVELLPDFIIGYYSGENKRIKKIIGDHEEIVLGELKKNIGLDKGLRTLFFGENFHAQIVLLTLLLYKMQNGHRQFKEKTSRLIDEFCSFSELVEITLVLKQPFWYGKARRQVHLRIENLEQNLLSNPPAPFPFWGAKGKAHKILTYLYNNTRDRNGYFDDEEGIDKLVLDSININDLAAGVHEEFDHPINFFDAFETLVQIESIHTLQLKVKSRYNDDLFKFAELSEGEQQLITVLGLILISGKDDCLFLLDEPDTHLNPTWQRRYVQLLNDFNLNGDNSHIIVATHSPLIVQAAENTDIFLYKKNEENGKVIVDENDMKIHNWRIDQVLASEYFGFENTRPPQLDRFMQLREELLSKPELTDTDIRQLREIEGEIGVLPTGETLNDFKAMHLVHSIANANARL